MKKALSLLTVLLMFFISSYGQAPGIFNYQGIARNSVGNVLQSQNITLRLTIHDLNGNGPVVYQETRALTTNPFGLFNVQVGGPGTILVTGTVAGINWATGAKFIQVEVDPNGGNAFTSVGSAQLASVPYSLFATVSGDIALPFNKTQANNGTLFQITNSGNTATSAAIDGSTNSTAGNAFALRGTVTSLTPGGFSTGLLGQNNGTAGLGIGVTGIQNGGGWGVYGSTPSGIGVYGLSTSGFGLAGQSTSGVAIFGNTTSTGTNNTGFFQNTNPANASTTLATLTNGTGDAVGGINTGTGRGGLFQISNPASTASAIEALTNGIGASWGIRATSTGTNGGGLFIVNNPTSTANNLQSNHNGLGRAGLFNSTNAANTANAVEINTNGVGSGLVATRSSTTGTNAGVVGNSASQDGNAVGLLGTITSTTPGGFSAAVRGINNGTSGLGIGVYGSQAGSGWGVYGFTPGGLGVYGNSTSGFGVYGNSTSGFGVYGSSSTSNAAMFEVTNTTSTGDAIGANQAGLGRGVYAQINNTSNIVAAIRGETNGGGYGVFGQATGNGNAGFFQVSNPASTSSTVNVTTNGIGSGITIQLTNASNGARGIDVLQAGVGPGVFATSAGGNAVWGIASSISAAGVIGDNLFGEAVVGRNRGGNGVGAVVGRNDSTGYGIRGFNTKAGIGALGQAGISGGTGIGGVFENVNAANPSVALIGRTNGTGAAFLANNTNGAATDIAIFQKSSANVARIDGTGKGFFNGGTQVGGADVAEYFAIEGSRNDYEAGDVLVISRSSDRKVEKSSSPYSTLVSGVFATKPGISLTEENAELDQLSAMVPMGVIGVIPTKVCAEGGMIKRGDLLVTSSIPGVAMKADLDKVKVGQVLGKALQDYDVTEIIKINVLVSVK